MIPKSSKEWLLAAISFTIFVLTSIQFYIENGEHMYEDYINDQPNSNQLWQLEGSLNPEDYETTEITLNKRTVEEAEEKLTEETAEETYSYIAAVVEYAPYDDEVVLERLTKNALAYIEFAKEAKIAGTDIIVFPEYGLTDHGKWIPDTTEELLPFSQVIPDPSEALVPCDFEDDVPYTQILKLLSCAVKDLQFYMVVQLVEQEHSGDMHMFYNTQIVFDRQGAIIARYRKINLYGELRFSRGPLEPELAMFTTDFGVTFTQMVCFDILFEYPGVYNVEKNGVKHVVMSTDWMDQLPSLASLQVQSGWAEYLGVNLIVANLHFPSAGATGSGIYPANTDLDHHYIFYSNGSKLITMHVTNTASNHDIKNKDDDSLRIIGKADGMNLEDTNIWHNFKYENLTIYSHVTLNHTSDGEMLTEKLCPTDEFCCNVNYTWPDVDSNTTYMMLAYDGFKEHAGGTMQNYYQICCILHCSSDDINSCAHVHVPKSNSFKVKSLYAFFQTPHVFPSLLDQDLTLLKRDVWSFENRQISNDTWKVAIHVDKEEQNTQLLTLNLYGRIFERDWNTRY